MGNDNHSMTYPVGNTSQRYVLAQKDGANRFSRVIKQASTGRARPAVRGQSVDQFRVASPPPPTTWRSWRTVDARVCCQSGLGFQLISIQMKDKLWRRVCVCVGSPHRHPKMYHVFREWPPPPSPECNCGFRNSGSVFMLLFDAHKHKQNHTHSPTTLS